MPLGGINRPVVMERMAPRGNFTVPLPFSPRRRRGTTGSGAACPRCGAPRSGRSSGVPLVPVGRGRPAVTGAVAVPAVPIGTVTVAIDRIAAAGALAVVYELRQSRGGFLGHQTSS